MAATAAAPDQLDKDVLLQALLALEAGDFSARLPATWTGVDGKIADTLNEVMTNSRRFVHQLDRASREVGKEGRTDHRVPDGVYEGGWAEAVVAVNDLIEDLVRPNNEISRVLRGVASGDLSQTVQMEFDGRPLQGQFALTARTVNTMVTQLSSVSSEVTRVAREVGTEGKLGGQARVKDVAGGWKDLTESVNTMAGNLTAQVRNIADVTTAVANGDLSRKITVEGRGEILELKSTINQMVDQLNSFAGEVTRVAREVGTDGKLGGQAQVPGVGGVWKDLTDNVNLLAGQLTTQIRNIAEVTTAVATGDLSRKVTVDVQGETLELKNTINVMVDQLNSFAGEVTRVAREVGTEGKLGGQAQVRGISGTWRDLTDNVNQMAANLTGQVRNIAEVTTAVANGDLSKKITVEGQGEILELKNTINEMVDQLKSFAGEVTRVAREVGTEGKLGGQADVKDVAGVWKVLTANVNFLAGQLTTQIRNIADVTTAMANGDLSRKVTVDVQGEILELKNTINVTVDRLSSFSSEVTRVAREVGTEGKLGGQAQVPGVSGTWRDLTDNVNFMAANLTGQVRNIAEVTTALANGDLSKQITVEGQGEILELKNTINRTIDRLSSFSSEVTRVAREVGTEGKLGGQAEVPGVSGTWRDLTDNVNSMAANLTGQVRNIADVTTAVANGDLSRKITVEGRGEILELKSTINRMVEQLSSFSSEVTRVAREVGTEGKLGGQANVAGVAGVWKDLTDNVNLLAGQVTTQIRNIAEVTTAVATGDLSRKVTVDVQGEILELKNTINVMVDQLNSFAGEVTRVAREVGTEGKLGGRAQVRGVSGTWRDLTDNVNQMADNLTEQVRGIARVVTAVADGDLKRKLVVEAKGEVAALAETINEMTDTLAAFAEQVTSVAREVGVEGRLGGQASVPGAAGTWKDLTENVNQLAATLTNQIRAIAGVSTAVTEGDLTRSIGVEASGEVAILKDKINQMIGALRETTQRNQEQDWFKTNLARLTSMLQGYRDLQPVADLILSELAPLVAAQHGVFYAMDTSDGGYPILRFQAAYALGERTNLGDVIAIGEGLVGQCAKEKERILLTNVPRDYVTISSGLGHAAPLNIVVLPILFEGHVRAVIELASFERFSRVHLDLLDQLTESIGVVLNTIEANMRTEELLKQSQSLAGELQLQQEELRQTNEELEQKAGLLVEQNDEVERKNREVEQARASLEEKAEQLAVTSRYKSEFLANMSHELRTPLNALLILAEQLAENGQGNLSDKQVEFANLISASGQDLLTLINDILDLSKIEAGGTALEIEDVPIAELCDRMMRTFRHVAEGKGLSFDVTREPGLPRSLRTDAKRLQQILKNLLSNAFKFTREGRVELRVRPATAEELAPAGSPMAVAMDVIDTGIGIPAGKERLIFEAFQQVESTASRPFGGTGLGLSISRELAHLLGGEIALESHLGRGSRFTVYMPLETPSPWAEIESAPGGEQVDADCYSPPDPDQAEDSGGLLVIGAECPSRKEILDAAAAAGIPTRAVESGQAALDLLHEERAACLMLLDLDLPDMCGLDFVKRVRRCRGLQGVPVVISPKSELSSRQRAWLNRARQVVLRDAGTPGELVAQVSRILACGEAGVDVGGDRKTDPRSQRDGGTQSCSSRAHPGSPLAGHVVLVVDDDIRNLFALTSLLEGHDMHVLPAENGDEAIEQLRRQPDIEVVLLDIMMPGKDGYDTLKQIRSIPELAEVPVIAVTAKAMKGDREHCLKAGATDYIAKPVQPARLFEMLEGALRSEP